jgi:hypothetical protein
MEAGEIMSLNWNRISMLSKLLHKNTLQKTEMHMRIAFQNAFAIAKTADEKKRIAESVEETFDEKTVKSVRSYLRKK